MSSEHAATPQFEVPLIRFLGEGARRLTGYWWVMLAAGIAWVAAALVILQFDIRRRLMPAPDGPDARSGVRGGGDVVVHCTTRRQAEYVLSTIAARMSDARLGVHPDKTRIVCWPGRSAPG
jgi:hypothetical protein